MIEEIIEAIKWSIENQAILQDLRVSQWNILKEDHFLLTHPVLMELSHQAQALVTVEWAHSENEAK